MLCPYCKGNTNFNNSNLAHKYKHKECNKYFKICPFCKTIYATENPHNLNNCIVVENIFDIDFCNKCNRAWLPDFPTSWTRSITNLNKIHELIQDIHINEQKNIDSNTLLNIQRSHFGITYNQMRANYRGIEAYIDGALRRRMGEYLNVLKNMGILKIKDYETRSNTHEFTKLGEEIANSSNPNNILAYFIISYLNIKLNNGYQRPQSNSCYKYFKIRFVHNILKIIDYKTQETNGATKYEIGLSLLARNETQFDEYCISYVDTYSSSIIKDMFFQNETELNRAVVSTFLNVLQSMGIIDRNNKIYSLTDLGNLILEFLDLRPAIWYEDIKYYAQNVAESSETIFAKLILWRLLNYEIIKENEIKLSANSLDNLVENITNKSIKNIKDIHLNLYYDEPLYNKNVSNTKNIIRQIHSLIKPNVEITLNDLDEICQLLHISWYTEIYDMLNRNNMNHILEHFIDSTDNIFQCSMQSGMEWHIQSKHLLSKLGLNVIDYKNNRLFANLNIDKLILHLPGGTIHNPDILILEKGYGNKNCILVDAKDQNSINNEMHKFAGYNIYSSHPLVNNYTIICLRGVLPNTPKLTIKSYPDNFNRITIIEESALKQLVDKKLSKDEVLNFLIPSNGFKHITVSEVNNI